MVPPCLYFFKLIKKENSPGVANASCLPGLKGCLLGVYGAKFSVRGETGHARAHTPSRTGAAQRPFPPSRSALFKAR